MKSKGTKVADTGTPVNSTSETPEIGRERGVYTKVQLLGFELSRTADVEHTGGNVFTVGRHIVNLDRRECTGTGCRKSQPRMRCPDWWAVAYTVWPPSPDEFVAPTAPVIEPVSTPDIEIVSTLPSESVLRAVATETRGGYKRHVREYDAALRGEERETNFFLRWFLPQICEVLEDRKYKGRGPHFIPLWKMLFAALLFTRLGHSFRNAESHLSFLADPRIGFIPAEYPGFNKINEFVRDAETTPILRDLLAILAHPSRGFGQMTLAGDGTGMSSNRFDDWRAEGKKTLSLGRLANGTRLT